MLKRLNPSTWFKGEDPRFVFLEFIAVITLLNLTLIYANLVLKPEFVEQWRTMRWVILLASMISVYASVRIGQGHFDSKEITWLDYCNRYIGTVCLISTIRFFGVTNFEILFATGVVKLMTLSLISNLRNAEFEAIETKSPE